MTWSALVALREAFGPYIERFTDRAIEVMAVARDEANSRRHAFVAPEHVLLALSRVKAGPGRIALQGLGVDLAQERSALESALEPALAAMSAVETGKEVARSARTQDLLRQAREQATALHHNYVGTEHLLLALLAVGSNAASELLLRGGVTVEGFRDELLRLLGSQPAET
jgi:ATP-dependent Clp protease ATP-binding subunit ClpC